MCVVVATAVVATPAGFSLAGAACVMDCRCDAVGGGVGVMKYGR